MRFPGAIKKLPTLALVLILAACGGSFRTYYDTPAPAAGWTVSDVTVSVPQTLTVSEKDVLLPRADIVWREDPAGDRHAQVATILRDAILAGASGLTGDRKVVLEAEVTRFHAVTFEAERRSPVGVHDIEFLLTARDAATGAVLAGPDYIEASFPAMTRAAMAAARGNGETQKTQITAHIARTIAGWLGVGPDNRSAFTSLGG